MTPGLLLMASPLFIFITYCAFSDSLERRRHRARPAVRRPAARVSRSAGQQVTNEAWREFVTVHGLIKQGKE